jgi:predicted dehydrogenase
VAHARIEFANGCVANLSASRVSFEAVRRMCVHTSSGYAAIDFAARTARVARPVDREHLDPSSLGSLSLEEKGALRDRFFTDVMRLEELPVHDNNALLDEQHDFVSAIRTGRAPRVPGSQALEAMRLAGQVLEAIAEHDRRTTERTSAMPPRAFDAALPVAGSVPAAPHWLPAASIPAEPRRRAG